MLLLSTLVFNLKNLDLLVILSMNINFAFIFHFTAQEEGNRYQTTDYFTSIVNTHENVSCLVYLELKKKLVFKKL